MDSLTQPEITTTALDAAAALITLLGSIDDQDAPEFVRLRDEAFWSIQGRRRELTGTLYDYYIPEGGGLRLLESWQQAFGGDVQATTERTADSWIWHALTTEIGGVPVVLKVPVEKPDIEQQLRDRITELEAALHRGAEGGATA